MSECVCERERERVQEGGVAFVAELLRVSFSYEAVTNASFESAFRNYR